MEANGNHRKINEHCAHHIPVHHSLTKNVPLPFKGKSGRIHKAGLVGFMEKKVYLLINVKLTFLNMSF